MCANPHKGIWNFSKSYPYNLLQCSICSHLKWYHFLEVTVQQMVLYLWTSQCEMRTEQLMMKHIYHDWQAAVAQRVTDLLEHHCAVHFGMLQVNRCTGTLCLSLLTVVYQEKNLWHTMSCSKFTAIICTIWQQRQHIAFLYLSHIILIYRVSGSLLHGSSFSDTWCNSLDWNFILTPVPCISTICSSTNAQIQFIM